MNQRVKVTSVLKSVVVTFSFLLLAGCVASKKDKFLEDQMAQGIKPLTANEITELFSGAVEYNKSSRAEFEGQYAPDGKIKGRAWWTGGESSDEGKWTVTDKDLFCTEWLGSWGKAGKQCYSVYPSSGENNYTLVQKSGTTSKAYPSGIMPTKITKK